MITTNKKININQLDDELGGYGLAFNDNNPNKLLIMVAEGSPVSDKELEEAIEKHIAEPSSKEIKALNREQGLAKLKELGFTDDEISALIG
jgi:hypothetical protein